jgi:hypothetical protein
VQPAVIQGALDDAVGTHPPVPFTPTRLQAPQVVLHHGPACGYTLGMKTAISLPDRVFREAERYAHRTKRTRSQLYCEALAEYLARHSSEEVTAAMNSVVDQVGPAVDRFASAAARRTLERTEW